jgi:serine phosphatase RsbU (regulator of sigma subunit)
LPCFFDRARATDKSTHGDGPADALVERIFRSVATFAGTAAQSDDMTLAVLVRAAPIPLEAAGARPS